jgi:nicotinate-nucleotide pyrophosphorylase (carboxylating)
MFHDRPMPPDRSSAAGGADQYLASLVSLALAEDVGTGDETTQSAVEAVTAARAVILAKAPGVISGLTAAKETARQVDPSVVFECLRQDGEGVLPGDLVAILQGPARSLLTMERVLLNFLQRLSGVATVTRRFVDAVNGTGVAIVDTRKTTPGMRFLEKAAVRHGGGVNHRFGLYDACMIKDNHIIAAGGITEAVDRVRQGFAERGRELPVIVEAVSVAEAEEAARLRVDQILLDNMEAEMIAAAVAAIRRVEQMFARADDTLQTGQAPHHARIEVSGGISLDTVREKALPGVDWISVGALTHSAPALDISMDIELTP